jgi:hypothetical protein
MGCLPLPVAILEELNGNWREVKRLFVTYGTRRNCSRWPGRHGSAAAAFGICLWPRECCAHFKCKWPGKTRRANRSLLRAAAVVSPRRQRGGRAGTEARCNAGGALPPSDAPPAPLHAPTTSSAVVRRRRRRRQRRRRAFAAPSRAVPRLAGSRRQRRRPAPSQPPHTQTLCADDPAPATWPAPARVHQRTGGVVAGMRAGAASSVPTCLAGRVASGLEPYGATKDVLWY